MNNQQRVLFCGREVFPQTWQVIKYHPTPASLFDPMSLGRLNVWFIVSASCKFTGGLKKKKRHQHRENICPPQTAFICDIQIKDLSAEVLPVPWKKNVNHYSRSPKTNRFLLNSWLSEFWLSSQEQGKGLNLLSWPSTGWQYWSIWNECVLSQGQQTLGKTAARWSSEDLGGSSVFPQEQGRMILFSLSFKGKCEVNYSDVTTLGLDFFGQSSTDNECDCP